MRRTYASTIVAMILISGLSGCAAAIVAGVTIAEQERLEKLDAWEKSLADMDCAQLNTEYANLVSEKDVLVDFDQREDIIEPVFEQKNCPLP